MKLYRILLICAAAVTAACTEEPRDFDMTPAAPPAPEEQYAAPTNPLGSIVVAHRGGATESGHPDNSLAGLKYALDLKVYAVECDIYATADNRVIVAHATQGCLVNGLKPWEHTYDELCAAGTLSNGERLPLLEDFLEEEPDGEVHEKLLEFYFEVSKFLNIYDLVDDHYVIYTYYAPDGSFLVRLYCVDTSANIQKCLDKANAAVFFSATLLPVQYYISLLSEAKDDYAIYARSPFDPKKRAVLIGTDVSSRYTRRGQEEYMRIAAYIKQTVMQKKGNYLAFFPSYRMLQDVMACTGPQLDTSIRCICQTSGMTEEEREAFLHEFEQKRKEDEGLLGFCVMGGIFGEGIDLKEDSLIGAIIVGTGIPQICREREILKQYYDGRNEDGFAYAYRYPGMNKVLQSAGRVIRTAQDRGVVLLLDERFAKSEYRKMFPREWEEYEYCSRSNVADKLGRFWELSEYEH